jgi:type I restriction enzyme S subunit
MSKNKLPKNWQIKTLGDICEIKSGKNQKKVINTNGKYPIYGSSGIFGNADEYICDENTTIIGRKGTINSPIYVTTKFWNVDTAFGLCAKEDDLNSKFLYYFCLGFNFKKLDKSTTIPSLSKGDLLSIQLNIPPLETQQAIVSKIEELFSELDKGIEDLKTAQQQLKTYRQSVLKWAFEGKLTEEWRKNRNENGTAKDLLNIIQAEKENEASRIGKKLKPKNSLSSEEVSQLSDLPLGWEWVSLGEIISDLTDYHANGSYLKIKENVELLDKPNYAIMIRATNFEKNNFSKDLKYITEEAYNYMSRSKLFGGEILIGKIGNAGRVYYMPKLNSPSSLAMNLFALRFNVDVNKYIHYHLLSSFSRQEISKYVKGVGNPTIDKNSIRSLSIALPSYEEQHQIVQEIESRLSVADKMAESIAQSLQQAEALRQSILKKAFSGELV